MKLGEKRDFDYPGNSTSCRYSIRSIGKSFRLSPTESKMSGDNTLERREREDKNFQKGFEQIAAIFWSRNFVQSEKIVEEEGFCLQPYDN